MDDARHFFPFLPVAFALGIAVYFVWPSEPGFYYLAALPILFAVGRVPSPHTGWQLWCLCQIGHDFLPVPDLRGGLGASAQPSREPELGHAAPAGGRG